MCGIAGIFSSNTDTRNRVHAMSSAIIHRGPDAGAVWCGDKVAFAHRRLSVIDVSEAANQPMHSHCGRYTIVFNGEIYNFKNLADKLRKHFPKRFENGFRTGSDTEIVLELFATFGTESVNWLNGMFAFAVYDSEIRKIFLCRDRLGIKPLFYSLENRNLFFASELKALFPAITSKTLNLDALPDYLHLGYFPGETTVIQEAKKFPAAHFAWYDGEKLDFTCYWELNHFARTERQLTDDYQTVRTSLKSTLENAVKDSLISDVPLGVFLSGGIDSGLVSAIAAKFNNIKTASFTIASPDQSHDESRFAREMAKTIGTEHHELMVDEKMLLSVVEKVLNTMDEPLADSSIFPTYIVSEFARKKITVALSGDGGDEQFMGYGSYRWAKRLGNPLVSTARPVARLLLRNKRHTQFFHPEFKTSPISNIFSVEQDFFPSFELQKYGFENYRFVIENKYFNYSNSKKQSLFDLQYYLRDDLLVKVDRASMLNSLEVRPPLLDHRVVDLSLRIPEKYKMNKGNGKYILRDILSDYVSPSLFERPKRGFSIPMKKWLRNDLKYLIHDHLININSEMKYIFKDMNIILLIDDYFNETRPWNYNRLWVLIVLVRYLKQNTEIEIPQ